MMDSCLAGMPDRSEPVEVDDIKRNLLDEFGFSPAQVAAPPQTENLQVYLRVRPFTAAESHSRDSQDCVTIEGPDTVALRAPRVSTSNQKSEKPLPQTAQRFTFTQVFGPDAGQRQVFNGSVRGLVRDVLQGGNCLVFTYGVTNAGKTFTFLGPEHDSGLLPRSLSVIFNSIEDRLYSRHDLKPQRCKDFSRLTAEQQAAESSSKRSLLRLFKETDKTLTSGRSTFLEGSSLSSDSSVSEPDSFCLDVSSNVSFSVWVSFCEIYNESIHDLLEQVPALNQRRTVLRLSQDVKGNSFIKDLRWVQVNSSEEAYRIMKIGKRNQSFSSTRLNYLSSRSHSIFSIRILRVDDSGVPRVLGVSELALCDLAGSERCSRTHNTGERLKEAGNINTSLLTLGKCINAMRLNQNSKFQHHIPFRESKLTHFLQNFFCGAGRVSMVVNINQSSSFFDETLNVLKFSALAQKVVVLSSQPDVPGDQDPQKMAMELSIIIDEAEERRNQLRRGRRSSLVAWETSLEDVQEDEDGEEDEEEEEDSMMEGTVLEAGGEEEDEVDLTMGDEEQRPDREAALRLVLEAQIREEVSNEFMELFKKMERDYSERLEKEREILEERADKRVEILKKLVDKTVEPSALDEERQTAALEEIISSMSEDLQKIKEGAQSVHHCLADEAQIAEIEKLQLENQRSHDQLQETLQVPVRSQSLEQQQQELRELREVCRQKEEVIVRLQDAVENAAADKEHACSCMKGDGAEEVKEESCKRPRDSAEESGGPARKRALLEEEIWRLQEENENKEKAIAELQNREERRRSLEEEVRRRNEEVKQLKEEQELLEQKVLMLTDLDACQNCDSVLASLEAEQRESARLQKENKALVNGIFQLQTEMTALQEQLKQQSIMADRQSEQLNTAKSRLQDLESQLEEKSESASSFRQEVERLRQRVEEQEEGRSNSTSVFHATMEELTKESKAALQRSAEKSQQIEELQGEKTQLEERLQQSLNRCEELTGKLATQRAELLRLQELRAELEAEGGALRERLQEMQRSEEERRREKEKETCELQDVLLEKDRLLDETLQQAEALRRELQRLKEELQRREEEEKENRGCEETPWRRQQETEGEVICLQDVPSPVRHKRRKSPRAVRGKRKSVEVEDLVFSENKRNRGRGGALSSRQEQKVAAAIIDSPSKAKGTTAAGLVGAVTTKPRRGRKKLLKTGASTPLLDSPLTALGDPDEDKESDHLIIKRKLRSKTGRK
ncbi:kinesin-like protein KIF20B isoform X1 [Oryzias latipes]|uniref:kinesin-like protein KIF20B isoform X1 n=1 Tax=Oryzias latipes TaxID=8090 RepID=UPI0009DA375F|nr:kinesin-like protein KIF20B isoform X1 [Oryzias latipes]XP_020557652.1 kinesin-like protein KIF20B isoform X1 [Oryzias latipes]XP_020557653.1 kinesin-like protein KIF20B isoform X1 [Oryzias latipes]XP_020557654.1 kinesin-like protein KIF20B isoform X1 [Oryzias latipes]XP_020557655.1 kinesin-like protein KIF20B isoform X1 [Oryzias latipes]